MKHLDDLLFWIKERQKIHELKEDGYAPPWSKDPILQNYRFCNVYREDDKVTRWIHNNWLFPNNDKPMIQFAMTLARMVNWPETLEEIGFPYEWDPQRFIKVIEGRKVRKDKVWTSAYMITGGFSAGGETKEVIIARVLSEAYRNSVENPIVIGDTLRQASEKVKTPGIGTFLGGQIVADLKWSPLLRNATDWWDWCGVGPGSTAGLNYLHNRNPMTPLPADVFEKEVLEIRDIVEKALDIEICAQNMQNCLCEFSKYVRTKYYGKRPKSQYRASNDSA